MKLLQRLVSLFLVGHLAIDVKIVGTFFRDDKSCQQFANLLGLSYVVLSTTIHIFYYMKQRVLSTAIDTKTIFWWHRPLLVLCILLIILTAFLGTWLQFPISRGSLYENNICIGCSSKGAKAVLIWVLLDIFCVVLLLILFVLPLKRFIRGNNGMIESQPLKRTLIRNVVLCSVAVLTTIVTWVVVAVLMRNKCDIHQSFNLSSQSLIGAFEQFVICNCILLTTTDWHKCLIWPCLLTSKTDATIKCLNPNMKASTEL